MPKSDITRLDIDVAALGQQLAAVFNPHVISFASIVVDELLEPTLKRARSPKLEDRTGAMLMLTLIVCRALEESQKIALEI